MDFQLFILECEEDLRGGLIGQAANKLRTVAIADIPRESARAFANLFRRAQLETLSLRLLTPIVRGEEVLPRASESEIAEYAAALQKIGAVQEAIDLLRTLDPAKAPDAVLFLAFCHFRRWDYAQAIPLLRRFVENAPDEYQQQVGQMNLAAAYAVEDMHFESLSLTKQLIERATAGGHLRLKTNGHELRAQIFIAQDKLTEARHELALAREPYAGKLSQPVDLFLVRKWETAIHALETRSIEGLNAFRAEAEERRDFESARDMDYFSLKVQFDEAKFQRLMFGTPFATYRRRVLKGLGREWHEESYRLGPAQGPSFSLSLGEFRDHAVAEQPSRMVHQLLAVLLRDLYKPWSIGALFSELFPGEYYNVFSSPNRVHQLLWRLRKWTEASQVPVELRESSGHYGLHLAGGFAFELPREGLRVDENVLHLRQLESRFRDKPSFTPREAQACLNISASSFKRLAQWGLKEQKLRREGASRATIYKLVG